MTAPHVKLQQNADELLRDFPVTEPDFEAQAQAIEARLQAPPTAGALSDDELFGAPDLAAEPAEPPLPSQVRTAAPKGHFAEMARRSLHQPEEDAAALAKELLAATAQSRRPNAELVERMRAASKSAPTATPLPLSEPRRERNSGVVPRAEATPKPPIAEAPSDKRGVVVALVGVALAAAAAVVLFVGGSPEGSTTSATLAAERASQAQAATAPAAPTPVAAAPQDEGVLNPDALPQAPLAVAKSAEATRTKPSVAAAAPAAKPGAAPPSSAAPVVELREDEPQRVAAAEPPAKPLEEPPLLPAQGNSGSVPLNPSSGAVSTALGSVRSGAQACLAGQTEAVTATVTFAADGRVLRVSAGGPSSSCIQAALSKAKIAPFAKESFSATTTIRPP